MKTITILSGKGGVGKSSITASLAIALSKYKKIICADCDVDASNLSIVIGTTKKESWNDLSTNEKIKFDYNKCTLCKKCYDVCNFDAICWDDKPILKEFSCEGCGFCELICPEKAITLEKIYNAKIGYVNSGYGFKVVSAQLNAGASGSGKVVFEVRKKARELAEDSEITLIDSSAGIGCPVIASVSGTDYAIVVTEPTPSGFSDMKKAIEVLDHFKVPYGIIINKFNINTKYTDKIGSFADEHDIEILARLPYDKKFTEALVNLTPIIDYDTKFRPIFDNISKILIDK
jgi:MinD superfamily P-loop ATPase